MCPFPGHLQQRWYILCLVLIIRNDVNRSSEAKAVSRVPGLNGSASLFVRHAEIP